MIKKEIQRLNIARKKYIAQKHKKNATKGTFDAVMIKALRSQLRTKKYKTKK